MGIIWYQIYGSPAGELVIGEYDNHICMCDWLLRKNRETVIMRVSRYLDATFRECQTPLIETAIYRLNEYFAGQRKEFDLPVILCGTEFQQKVWKSLLSIPYGQTISYAQQAALAGAPKAIRAVAAANAANAVSIIVPCHRVVGSNNTLTGYAGGLHAKQFLLQLEARQIDKLSDKEIMEQALTQE